MEPPSYKTLLSTSPPSPPQDMTTVLSGSLGFQLQSHTTWEKNTKLQGLCLECKELSSVAKLFESAQTSHLVCCSFSNYVLVFTPDLVWRSPLRPEFLYYVLGKLYSASYLISCCFTEENTQDADNTAWFFKPLLSRILYLHNRLLKTPLNCQVVFS